MKIKPFTLERWQSIWENRVGINLSESGVLPMSVAELVDDPKEWEKRFPPSVISCGAAAALAQTV